MIIEVDEIGVKKDEKYFRVLIKVDTHTFHTEKLNEETKNKILGKLLDVEIGSWELITKRKTIVQHVI